MNKEQSDSPLITTTKERIRKVVDKYTPVQIEQIWDYVLSYGQRDFLGLRFFRDLVEHGESRQDAHKIYHGIRRSNDSALRPVYLLGLHALMTSVSQKNILVNAFPRVTSTNEVKSLFNEATALLHRADVITGGTYTQIELRPGEQTNIEINFYSFLPSILVGISRLPELHNSSDEDIYSLCSDLAQIYRNVYSPLLSERQGLFRRVNSAEHSKEIDTTFTSALALLIAKKPQEYHDTFYGIYAEERTITDAMRHVTGIFIDAFSDSGVLSPSFLYEHLLPRHILQTHAFFTSQLLDQLNSPDSLKYLPNKVVKGERLIEDAYSVIRQVIERAAHSNGAHSQNAQLFNSKFSELQFIGYGGVIKLANQVITLINNNGGIVIDKDTSLKEHLPLLNSRLSNDLDKGFSILLRAIYQLDTNVNSRYYEEDMLLSEIVSLLLEKGLEKKDSQIYTLGDLALRFPNATYTQLQRMAKNMRGKTASEVYRYYQDHIGVTGKHVKWQRNKRGYGFIS